MSHKYVTVVFLLDDVITDAGFENGLEAVFKDPSKVNETIRSVLCKCIEDIQVVESSEIDPSDSDQNLHPHHRSHEC